VNCGNCHEEVFREWQASGHARSINGRRFRNLYDGSDWSDTRKVGWSLLKDNPDGAGVCAACHAPAIGPAGHALDDLTQLGGVAAHGVHCDYCHKISAVGAGKLGLTHGRFNLTMLRPTKGQLFFGPLDDVDRNEDTFSPLYKDSKYCASCHEGIVFGVPVYTTYSEWQTSPAARDGKQCQDCHMKPTGALTNIAPGKGGITRDPKTLANHRFFAGSQLDMLRRCLHLDVQVERVSEGVKVAVQVQAEHVGHRVPTGFVDRHLLLIVEARQPSGKVVECRAGPVLPAVAGRALAGKPGKLYAKLLRDFDGHSPVPFWRADPAVSDTRLLPGQPDRLAFVFPERKATVHVRLLYRRFWKETVEDKGWPEEDLEVATKSVETGQ
jgi:hypothetical protein